MNNITAILGPPPPSFNYDAGTARYKNLIKLDPRNPLLIPPNGAPSGTVSLSACEVLAGPGYGGYGRANTLDSLATWVIPLLILLGNLVYSSFRRQRYWNQITITLHLIGNPIDAVWALLTKLDVKRRIELRCRDYFQYNRLDASDIWIYSTILYALDDFGFCDGFQYRFEQLMRVARFDNEAAKAACKRAAIDLSIARIKNTRRAVFAILGYLAAITANIIRAIFSGTVPIHFSHTIALRVLDYWLITAIILSAAVGGLPSEWTSVGILKELQSKADLDFNLRRLQPWDGGNQTWCPKKDISRTLSGARDCRHLLLGFLAFLSVTIAALISFLISHFTPTRGVGVRSIVELVFWAWWCLNGTTMYLISRYQPRWLATQKGWLIAVAKDSLAALFTILFVLSAWSGWWNSCYHWSMVISRGKERAYVDLVNMKVEILGLMKKEFPIAIGLGTGTEIALACLMIWIAHGGMSPSAMKEEDAEEYFVRLLEDNESPAERTGRSSTSGSACTTSQDQDESKTALLNGANDFAIAKHRLPVITVQEWELDDMGLNVHRRLE